MLSEEYYAIHDLELLIDDMDALNEYLNGWDDAVINDYWYKKQYVDMFMSR